MIISKVKIKHNCPPSPDQSCRELFRKQSALIVVQCQYTRKSAFHRSKVESLSTMPETLDKLTITILEKYPARTAADQELRYFKLDLSLSLPLLANIAPVTPSKFDGCSPADLLPHQVINLNWVFVQCLKVWY